MPTQPFNGPLPVWANIRRNIHPLTPILIIRHPLSTSSIYYDPQHPPCSIYMFDSPFPQPLSRSSLIFLLVLDPRLHTSYISSPNHHILFATQDKSVFTLMPTQCTHPFDHFHLCSLKCHLTLSLQARSHFHATYCFHTTAVHPFSHN